MVWTSIMSVITVTIIMLLVLMALLPECLHNKMVTRFMNVKELLNFKKLKRVTVITIIFMILTHLYIWVNGVFLFDVSWIYREPIKNKIGATDTWLRPLIDNLFDGGVNLPWLSGVWAIIFMVVSIYCITDILEIKKTWAICLVAGLCSANSAIICQNEFTGGAHVGELALAFASVALWILTRERIKFIKKTAIGAILIALSIATYGAYVSIVPSLMLCLLLVNIVNGASGKDTWKKAFSYLFQFLLGIVLYYIVLRLLMLVSSEQLSAYANEDNLANVSGIFNMLKCIPLAYKRIIIYYLAQSNYLPPVLSYFLYGSMLLGGFMTIYWFWKNRCKIKNLKANLFLTVIIIALLPMAINLIDIVSSLYTYYLMIFTYIIPLLFFVRVMQDILEDHKKEENNYTNYGVRGIRFAIITGITMTVFLYYSIVMGNAVYVKYVNSYNRSLSLGTRIMDRIENCEGFDGTERIVFIGDMHNQSNLYFNVPEQPDPWIIDANLGMASAYYPRGISYGYMTEWFLHNSLDSRMKSVYYATISDYKEWENIDEDLVKQLESMDEFPNKESVKKINDQIYVIFSKYVKPYEDCFIN